MTEDPAHPAPLLRVQNLSIHHGTAALVKGISFEVHAGQVTALVGESGSGKSLTALSLVGLLPRGVTLGADSRMQLHPPAGTTWQLHALKTDAQWRPVRALCLSMVFQDPMASLNPMLTVGEQVAEGVRRLPQRHTRRSVRQAVVQLFQQVNLPEPEAMLRRLPHQLSGGQQQRVLIAIALAARPALILADEPTTALDTVTQHSVLALLTRLTQQLGMALLLISHDLALVSTVASHVLVMHQGALVEQGPAAQVFHHPQQPYTQQLVQARRSLMLRPRHTTGIPSAPTPLVQVTALSVHVGKGRRRRPLLTDISLNLYPGQTLGVVGASGSGKSTLGAALLRLSLAQVQGQVLYQGHDLMQLRARTLRLLRRHFQPVPQDAAGALDYRFTVGQTLLEPMRLHGTGGSTEAQRRATAQQWLERVSLPTRLMDQMPHRLSGGQRQRLVLARALACQPQWLVADECLSALDVTTQAGIVTLLEDLQRELGLAYLFISHDLELVARLASHVMVLHQGQCVEQGPAAAVIESPQHPATQALVQAMPRPVYAG